MPDNGSGFKKSEGKLSTKDYQKIVPSKACGAKLFTAVIILYNSK